MLRKTAFAGALGLASLMTARVATADEPAARLAYSACVDYYAELYRLCQCIMTAGACEQTFGFMAQYKCRQYKALRSGREFYGSCLAKLRRASCATPRRGLMDAPQSCESAFIERTTDDWARNPWGESEPRRPATKPGEAAARPAKSERPDGFVDPWADEPAQQRIATHPAHRPGEAWRQRLEPWSRPKRVSGDAPHLPAEVLKQRRGSAVSGSYKICVATNGRVETVDVVSSIPGADESIMATLRTWFYDPPPEPVCTTQFLEFAVE